jgi:hypothetical protein
MIFANDQPGLSPLEKTAGKIGLQGNIFDLILNPNEPQNEK